jgi:hypothetical protein
MHVREWVLGGAVVAMVAIGGTVVGLSGGGGGKSPQSDSAYAGSLAAVATDLRTAVGPADIVLLDSAGNQYGARDALAQAGPVVRFEADQARLAKLAPPSGLATDQADLRQAATRIDKDLQDLRSKAVLVGYDAFLHATVATTTDLDTAESQWDAALADAFSRLKARAPINFMQQVDVSHTKEMWLFRAAGRCDSAEVSLIYRHNHVNFGQVAFSVLATVAPRLGERLAGLPRPTGSDALPAGITSKLPALSDEGRVITDLLRNRKSGNKKGLHRDAALAHLAIANEATLVKALSNYGSQDCVAAVTILLNGSVARPTKSSGGIPT